MSQKSTKHIAAKFFSSAAAFRKWLEKNHDKKSELQVGFYKVKTGKPSMTWSESVDQALCFGWIDGVRNAIDEERYCIRFTPRKKTSFWSAINIKKVAALTKAGLMTEAGKQAFSHRAKDKSTAYSYEKIPVKFDPVYERQFKRNKVAWKFFAEQAPSYKKVIIHWMMSAKQEKTRASRLEKIIQESEMHRRVL